MMKRRLNDEELDRLMCNAMEGEYTNDGYSNLIIVELLNRLLEKE
jgi:hypothetical protein